MMKTHQAFLILRQLILTALIAAVGACSFKKNPAKDIQQVFILQEKETLKKDPTLEEIISQEDENRALEELSKIRISNINEIKTADGSLLDTTIKFEKKNILNYLLIQGHSPFLLGETSQSKLTYSDEFNKIIVDAQKDRFMGILREYSNEDDYQNFKKAIIRNKMGFAGCQNFINFLMNLKYSHQEKGNPGAYYRVLTSIPTEDVIKRVLTETECSNLTKRFSTEKISEWLSNEILVQFTNNFSDSKFFEFISTLGNGNSIVVNLANNKRVTGPSLIKLNPMLLLMLKRPCFNSHESFASWLTLFKKHINKDRSFYTITYSFKEDFSETDGEIHCEGDHEYCSTYYKNNSNLTLTYGLLFPALQYDDILYSKILGSLADDSLSKEASKLKKEICASPEEFEDGPSSSENAQEDR